MTDAEHLQRYTREGSSSAFAELVSRHLDLVYSVARRHLGSTALAEDVAQSVFLELARHAPRLAPATPLVAWLHTVSRRKAIDTIRRESRRRAREEVAAALALPASPVMPAPSSDWPAIEPLLDEAVDSLPPADRTAILLRFFENKSLRDIGAALGISDDAAQKRVSRALDHLRAFFLRRGIATTAATLGADLSAAALHPAPTALAAAIASFASTSPVLVAPLLTMSLAQKSLVGAAVLALGGAVFQANQLLRQRSALADLSSRQTVLEAELRDARAQHAAALQRASAARDRLAAAQHLAAPAAPADPAIEAEIKAWFSRIAALRQLAEQRPELTIPEMKLLSDQDWHSVADSDGASQNPEQLLSRLRVRAKNLFSIKLQAALNDYIAAHAGTLPATVAALQPFFRDPPDPAMLERYAVVQRGTLADAGAKAPHMTPVIIERPSDHDEAHIGITAQGFTLGPFNLREHAARAARSYAEANPKAPAPAASTLLPFFDPPLTPGLQDKFLQSPQRYLPR